jgi:hypothetical protein
MTNALSLRLMFDKKDKYHFQIVPYSGVQSCPKIFQQFQKVETNSKSELIISLILYLSPLKL